MKSVAVGSFFLSSFLFGLFFPQLIFAESPVRDCDPSLVVVGNPAESQNFRIVLPPITDVTDLTNRPPGVRPVTKFSNNTEYLDMIKNCNNRQDALSLNTKNNNGYTITAYDYCNAAPIIQNRIGATDSRYIGCWPIITDSSGNKTNTLKVRTITFKLTCQEGDKDQSLLCKPDPANPLGRCVTINDNNLGCKPEIKPACPAGVTGTISLDSTTGQCFYTSVAVPKKGGTADGQIKVHLCTPDESPGGCDTAIGKIPLNPAGLFEKIIKLILGTFGAVVIIRLIITGYSLATSAGDPEKIKGIKESLTAIAAGTGMIIFSLVLLRTIGVDILGIPSLTKTNVLVAAEKDIGSWCLKNVGNGPEFNTCFNFFAGEVAKGKTFNPTTGEVK